MRELRQNLAKNLAKSRIQKIRQNLAKFRQKLANFFKQKIEIEERCKGVDCIDLGESFRTDS